jgi:hypothetical protein
LAVAALTALSFTQALGNQVSHFPSPHQPWTSREYVDFYFAHYNGNRALPHLRSEDTASLFGRVVSRENLRRIVDSSLADEIKRIHVTTILATMGEVRAAYGYAVHVGEPLQEELARIQSFMLFLLETAVRLGDKGAAEWAGTQALKTTLGNIVGSLAEREVYSDGQIASMAAALHLHYPQISRILSEAEKKKIRARIGALAASETDRVVRQAKLQLLYTVLKN